MRVHQAVRERVEVRSGSELGDARGSEFLDEFHVIFRQSKGCAFSDIFWAVRCTLHRITCPSRYKKLPSTRAGVPARLLHFDRTGRWTLPLLERHFEDAVGESCFRARRI